MTTLFLEFDVQFFCQLHLCQVGFFSLLSNEFSNFHLVHSMPPFASSIDDFGDKVHELMVEWGEINHQ